MPTVIVYALSCYPYYPFNAPASATRAPIMARYLPEFGWRPIVITYPWGKQVTGWRELYAQSTNRAAAVIPVDEGYHWAVRGQRWCRALAEKRPRLKSIAKLATLLLWLPNWGAFDDEQAGWHRLALKVGREISRLERVDAVWATWTKGWGPLWAAERLASELGIPWIADISDDWRDYKSGPPFYLAEIKIASLLRRVRRANMVTTVSQPWVELVRDRVNPNAHLIHNGYLPDMEQYVETRPDNIFTLVFTGSMSGGLPQSLGLLCQAMRLLSEEDSNFARKARFVYYGNSGDSVQSIINEYGLSSQATVSGVIPPPEARRVQQQGTVLVVLIPDPSLRPGVMTSKIYDYLAARRPILSIVGNPDTVNPLLTETGAGVWADDVETIMDVLRRWFHEWEQHGRLTYHGYADAIERYSPRHQMSRLAALLDELVDTPRAK